MKVELMTAADFIAISVMRKYIFATAITKLSEGEVQRTYETLKQYERLERLVHANALEGRFLWVHKRGALAIRSLPPPDRNVPTDYQFEWMLVRNSERGVGWEDVGGPYNTVYQALAAADKLKVEKDNA